MSYFRAGDRRKKADIIGSTPHDKARKFMHNTVKMWHGQNVMYKFHRTVVYTRTPTSAIIDTGGYNTYTTRLRISKAKSDCKDAWFSAHIYNWCGIMITKGDQMISAGSCFEVPVAGGLSEHSHEATDERWLKYSGVGTVRPARIHPNEVEWDGRASTLRFLLNNSMYPWRLLNRVKDIKLSISAERNSWWESNKIKSELVIVYRFGKGGINLRKLVRAVLKQGHLGNLDQRVRKPRKEKR